MGIPFKQYLYGAITFATVLMVLLNVWVFRTSDTALQEFFAITVYFAFLVWACGQLWLIRAREREQARKPVTAAAVASDEPPLGEASLSFAQTYLNMGENINTVCAMIEPRYADWSASRREAFRAGVFKALQERTPKPEEGEPA
jgi:hypothetical protein